MRVWLLAARPKTLGAAIAPVLIGGALAYGDRVFYAPAFVAAMLVAILIQIGTNFANDYFDHQKGADTAERIGPVRATAAGLIQPEQMRKAFLLMFFLAALVGCYLAYRGGWLVVMLGLLSIACGILYTGGPFPFAYIGFSELLVIVFFGPVAVAGTYYVQALHVSTSAILLGLCPGLVSTTLLVTNNLRDREQDTKASKKTLAVRFGVLFSQMEYTGCLVVALLILAFYLPFTAIALALIAIPLVKQIWTFQMPVELNGLLARTGQFVLLLSAAFSVGWLL